MAVDNITAPVAAHVASPALDESQLAKVETVDDRTGEYGSFKHGPPLEEESEQARVERLGRMRPEIFRGLWDEFGFCFSVVMSQALTVRRVMASRFSLDNSY